MKRSDEDKLHKVLTIAYREKEHATTGDGWQGDVMRRVRHLQAAESLSNTFEIMNRFIWRFAATACVLVLILSAYILQENFQTSYELAQLFVGNPLEFSLVQSFGIL